MNNQTVLDELDYYVIGHREAKKALIAMITRSRLRHYQKYMKGMDDEFLLNPMKILLIGPSGSGKTHMLESLQKVIHFPLVRVDATQMNPAGSSGGIKPDDLKKRIIEQAKLSCELFPNRYFSIDGAIDKTVVFVDEVDKLGTSFESSGNWNRHVQSNYLTLFDNKNEYAGVSFVFAGAFTGITNEELRNSIGFNSSKYSTNTQMIDEKVIASGLIPEFVGRITNIIELDKFDKEMYMYILNEKLLPKKRLDMAAFGVFDLKLEEEYLNKLAEEACKSNQGVRYLHRELDRHFLELEFDAGVNYSIYNDH